MKVFITGGSGFVGSYLTQKLIQEGQSVTILTRKIKPGAPLPEGASFTEGDPTKPGIWQESLAQHDAIINLAGASIFQRWTEKRKKELYDSRIHTTTNIVHALAARKGKETHLLSTSAIGYYGFHGDEDLYEDNEPGDDFLAHLARDWEAAALKAKEYGVRVVLCRFGVVMGRRGGALSQLVPIFNKYLGAPLGNGKQWFSWIHEEDLANIFLFLLHHKEVDGPINCTAPNPLRNKELTKILGEVLHKPTVFPPVPRFVLRIFLGEFAGVLVKGQRVFPRKLLDHGFTFKYPTIREALHDILQ
ncbi:MAG: TIGR01777 family oxidoreductase [Deltaproteobacteria bacterium]|nr:TIGR01777 family oxidoreductase [Deltaproteobacteria bacterium]